MKRPVEKYANSEERHHHVTSQPFGGGGQKSNNDMMGVGEQEIETTDEDSVFCLTSSAPYPTVVSDRREQHEKHMLQKLMEVGSQAGMMEGIMTSHS